MKRGVTGTGGLMIVFGACFIAAILLIARLFFIQIIKGDEYAALASSQYIRPVHQLFNRGDIYMQPRVGKPLPVALMKEAYTLYINPGALGDPESTYEKVNEITPVDRELFMKSAAKHDDPYEVLDTGLGKEVMEEI